MVSLKAASLSSVPIVLGILMYRYAYTITRIGEQIDAIGSKTRLADVDPVEWNVFIGKGIAVMLVIIGLLLLFGALLA